MHKRHIIASRDTYEKMKIRKLKRLDVFSFFPVDPASCPCQVMIEQWKDKLAAMSETERNKVVEQTQHLTCPRDKSGMNRYEIKCAKCGAVQGYCWATDATLKDFCDFHYVQWTDGNEWFGNLTPNISPIDGSLGLECTCSNDTRDFRANQTMSLLQSIKIEESNREGREFSKPGAKFTVHKITAKMKPKFDSSLLEKAPAIQGREL